MIPKVEASRPEPPSRFPALLRPAMSCAVCGSSRLHYLFSVAGARVVRCDDCLLMMRDRRMLDEQIAASGAALSAEGLPATAGQYLDLLALYRGNVPGRMLSIVRGGRDFSAEAVRRGWEVANGEPTGLASLDPPPAAGFDVVALYNVIDAVPDPAWLLRHARAALAPGGVLFIATFSFDTWSQRQLRDRRTGFHTDRCFYFTRAPLETLLIQNGFGQVITRMETAGPVGETNDGMVFMARPQEPHLPRKLSLVVPAYNEAATFEANFEKLLAKTVEGLEIEIVVVESNSTDGTRAMVARYENHPRVTVVWEDRPQGKGHAVRGGLQRITGDYVLIQDADLEYDLEDYEALLEPLVQGRAAFVLGARHGGSAWKMRSFSGQPVISAVLNLAHWFFTMLVNVGFHARLKDPFTMYKVFRRDCLHGLNFECNRFDFDFELVIKLLRKGYQPLEIPVNYRSRSFAEGKKVSFFGDPLTWLRALVKFRLEPMDPLANIAQDRRHAEVAAAGSRPATR